MGVSVQRVSLPWGSLSRGSLSRRVSVWGSLSMGVSVWEVSVQGVSVWGVSVRAVSVWGPCPEGSLLGRPPYSNEQAVHILLECILVISLFSTEFIHGNSFILFINIDANKLKIKKNHYFFYHNFF